MREQLPRRHACCSTATGPNFKIVSAVIHSCWPEQSVPVDVGACIVKGSLVMVTKQPPNCTAANANTREQHVQTAASQDHTAAVGTDSSQCRAHAPQHGLGFPHRQVQRALIICSNSTLQLTPHTAPCTTKNTRAPTAQLSNTSTQQHCLLIINHKHAAPSKWPCCSFNTFI